MPLQTTTGSNKFHLGDQKSCQQSAKGFPGRAQLGFSRRFANIILGLR
ncbi:MAG: hypothetical protein OFPI_35740 [Osedax symbiont Rs2]|nr:MAG: hypothetical protein OFPI_35740 [Osedax symbiont Rs2]